MKPMLAATLEDVSELKYPVYASAKIDGVRAIVKDATVFSRALKPIPNRYVQKQLGFDVLSGIDGELVVGPANDKNVMQATTSGVMTKEGQPDFTLWVFDYWTAPTLPFSDRHRSMVRAFKDNVMVPYPRIQLLKQELIQSEAELVAFEKLTLMQGFEGVMIRKVDGGYKYGRSTLRESHLLKLKRFTDAEAVVIGFKERMHNSNEATRDERGYAKRSSHAAGMVPMGTLGAFSVRNAKGEEFDVGTGFNDAQRAFYWAAKESYIGKLLVYKSFEAAGVKDAPRFPVFKSFRDPIDTGEAK